VADRSTAAVDVAKESGAPLDGAAAAAATPGATIDAVDKNGNEARSESEAGPGGDQELAATAPLPDITETAQPAGSAEPASSGLNGSPHGSGPNGSGPSGSGLNGSAPGGLGPGGSGPNGSETASSRAAGPRAAESSGTPNIAETAEMSLPEAEDSEPGTEATPADGAPGHDLSAQGTAADSAPADEATADEATAGSATPDGTSSDGTSSGAASADSAPGGAAQAPQSPSENHAASTPAPPAPPAPAAPAPDAGLPDPPELHSGHKLARRYRLEECVARAEGFSSWRAVDEMLRRAVGIHVLRSHHPRAKRVLAAARSAALLGDPRFVQVLDAVEEDDLVYVVHEWLPDAVELTAVLAAGPMQPYEADQMVRQLAEAMAAAHREGLAHLKLTPYAVLRTDGGQFRIRGLAVAAALHGRESARPQREDTEAIGALLYAALTHRWPYPEDAHGLTGLPPDIGLVPPDQVRAGVHRGLSELAMRALVNNGATPIRQEPACATPEELAKAAAGMPKVRPPEPEISPYQRTAYQRGSYRQPPARGPMAQAPAPAVPPPPPPALPGRTGKVLKWTVSALLIAALGLGSWQIGDALLHKDKPKDRGSSSSSGSKTAHAKPAPLPVTRAQEYVAKDDAQAPGTVGNTYDKSASTYWQTHFFLDGPPIKIKPGVGILYDLGSRKKIDAVTLSLLYGGPETAVRLYASDAYISTAADSKEPYAGMTELGSTSTQNTRVTVHATKNVRTRYVLVWLTSLPKDPAGPGFRQGITNVTFTGTGR
jgi:serine/threonine protein kinase